MVNLNQFFITIPRVFFQTIFKNYYWVALAYLIPCMIMNYLTPESRPTNFDEMYPGYTGQMLYLTILINSILIFVSGGIGEELLYRFWTFADAKSYWVRVFFVAVLLYSYHRSYAEIRWATGLENLPFLSFDYEGTILGFIMPTIEYLKTTIVGEFLLFRRYHEIIDSIIFVLSVEVSTRVWNRVTKKNFDPWKLLGFNHKFFGYVWAIFSFYLFILGHPQFVYLLEKNIIIGLIYFLALVDLYILYYFYGLKRAIIFHIFANYALSYVFIDKLNIFDQLGYHFLYFSIFALLAFINIRFALENKIIDRFPKNVST
jgi:hypothetical protein